MFYDYTMKDYMEICYLLLRPESQVERFMWKFDLSRYEYGICKQHLMEMEDFYGITLDFGEETISWHITDEERYRACEKNCWTFYYKHRHGYLADEEFARGLYIVKRLLLARDCTNLEGLTEEMGFSRSAMRGALKLARGFMSSYGIRLENVPRYGVCPVGNELDIRRGLVALYNFLDVNVIPEIDNGRIAEGLASKNYSKLHIIMRDFLDRHGSAIAHGQTRKLIFFVVIQNIRIQSGQVFQHFCGVDQGIVDHITCDSRLRELSGGLLSELEEKLSYGPYSEMERQAVAFMFLETFEDEKGLYHLVEESYAGEFHGLQERLVAHLEAMYGLCLERLYQQSLGNILRETVVSHHMGILEEKGTSMDGLPPLISDYPLMRHIYEGIAAILTQYFKIEAARVACTAVCELIGFYIQNMEYPVPRLRVGVATRQALYKQGLILNVLRERLAPSYYSTLESCDYEEVLANLEEARSRYDVVICDQRLSNDKLFLPISDFYGNFDNLNQHLRMMRDLCDGLFRAEDIHVRELDPQQKEDWQALEMDLRQYGPVDMEKLLEPCEGAGVQGCLVAIFPDQQAEHNLLRMGELKKRYQKRYTHYMVYRGQINSGNIKRLNMLFYKLTQDPLFWGTMLQLPTPETINSQLNSLL